MLASDPLHELGRWLAEAHSAKLPAASSVAFITVGAEGRPSARTVTLKRFEQDALLLFHFRYCLVGLVRKEPCWS